MNPQLQTYIQQAKAAGQTNEQIRQALLQAGWDAASVEEALGGPSVPPPGPGAPVPPPVAQPMPGASSTSNNTVMAAISYLGILWLIPLLTDAKHDPFVKFHIKQGIVLTITAVIGFAIGAIPFVGWALSPFITLGLLVLTIMGIVNAVGNKQQPLPVIGSFASSINL